MKKTKFNRELDKCWENCLAMWKWISKVWTPDGDRVATLKERWINKNGLPEPSPANCFFCDFANEIAKEFNLDDICPVCPGKLISSSFGCQNSKYHYAQNPRVFYQKLVELNKKRLAEER